MTSKSGYVAAVVIALIFFLFPMSKAIGNIGAFLLLVFGFLFLFNDLIARTADRSILFIGMPFLLIFIFACVGLFYGKADFNLKIDFFIKSLRYPAIFFGAYFLYKFNLRNIALRSFSASMAFTVALVYASVVIPIPWVPKVEQSWGGDHTIWGDYITQSIMVSFFSLLMFHEFLQSSNNKTRLISIIFSILGAVSVMLLSSGRTGYVMLLITFLIYCFVYFKGWQWRIAALCIVCISLIFLYFGVDIFRNRIDLAYLQFMAADGKNSLTSIGARLFMWMTAWELGKESIWLGVGSGSYALEWCARVDDLAWCNVGQHPHNNFLLLFVSNGIFSLAAYIFILLAGFGIVVKKVSTDYLLVLIFLVILVIDSFLNGPFWNVREANFFALLAAPVLATVFEKLKLLKIGVDE